MLNQRIAVGTKATATVLRTTYRNTSSRPATRLSSLFRHDEPACTSPLSLRVRQQSRAASTSLFCSHRPSSSSTRAATTATTTLNYVVQIRRLSSEVRAAIDKAVDSAPVVLFMKGTPETPQCGFSRATVQILGLQGVDPAKFVAFNVLEDQDLREGIKEYSEWPTIPQLYVNKEFVGGCDILMQMHQDGSLGRLLDKEGVLVLADAEAEASSEK